MLERCKGECTPVWVPPQSIPPSLALLWLTKRRCSWVGEKQCTIVQLQGQCGEIPLALLNNASFSCYSGAISTWFPGDHTDRGGEEAFGMTVWEPQCDSVRSLTSCSFFWLGGKSPLDARQWLVDRQYKGWLTCPLWDQGLELCGGFW